MDFWHHCRLKIGEVISGKVGGNFFVVCCQMKNLNKNVRLGICWSFSWNIFFRINLCSSFCLFWHQSTHLSTFTFYMWFDNIDRVSLKWKLTEEKLTSITNLSLQSNSGKEMVKVGIPKWLNHKVTDNRNLVCIFCLWQLKFKKNEVKSVASKMRSFSSSFCKRGQ